MLKKIGSLNYEKTLIMVDLKPASADKIPSN